VRRLSRRVEQQQQGERRGKRSPRSMMGAGNGEEVLFVKLNRSAETFM